MIADAARTLPHTLRRVGTGDDTLARLVVLAGYDDDLAGEVTRIANRIRGLLTQIHPPLERVLGPKVQHPAVLEALSRCGGPAGLRKAGRAKLAEIVKKRAPPMGARLVEQIFVALDAQTVVVPGTTAAETILPRLADSLSDLLKQRENVAEQVEGMLDAHPLRRAGDHRAQRPRRIAELVRVIDVDRQAVSDFLRAPVRRGPPARHGDVCPA